MLKRERDKLGRLLVSYLTSIGATLQQGQWWERWQVETSLGVLSVNYHDDYGSIMIRFDNPEIARKRVNCNPYTGKWNLHFGRVTAIEAFGAFKNRLESVCPQ